ncbi:hypothetical protein HK097_000517, partial [Rhizophlyctis rosea]
MSTNGDHTDTLLPLDGTSDVNVVTTEPDLAMESFPMKEDDKPEPPSPTSPSSPETPRKKLAIQNLALPLPGPPSRATFALQINRGLAAPTSSHRTPGLASKTPAEYPFPVVVARSISPNRSTQPETSSANVSLRTPSQTPGGRSPDPFTLQTPTLQAPAIHRPHFALSLSRPHLTPLTSATPRSEYPFPAVTTPRTSSLLPPGTARTPLRSPLKEYPFPIAATPLRTPLRTPLAPPVVTVSEDGKKDQTTIQID